ncbi:MAG: hypothetical protein K9K64_09910 [Desulfohalobiaceae bacterium]|nr:hypothetical protein [Desulfohalobiaceae bacterium]
MPKVGTSRITPPSLPRILERPRLVSRLKENEDHRLILILGQAAQGKSTLAAALTRSSSLDNAWINVLPEDDNPVNLFYATASALSFFLDERDVDFLLNYPASQLGPRDREALYRDWGMTLFSRIDYPIRVTFDGLDRLSDESQSFYFLQAMLEQAPENVRFILLSRREPPFPLQEWKMKQRAFVLYNKDLAFTYPETRSFLQQHCGLSCEQEQVKKIWLSTEGWTGGLVLLSQVLQNAGVPELGLDSMRGMPHCFQAEVYLYFAEEIFAGLSERDVRILLHSSVFEEVVPGFLDDLLGIRGSEEILQDLTRRNLFVSAVSDASRGWIYRHHQLYREFLQSMWQKRVGPQERKRFLRRTARACARKNSLESAVDFFLQAEDFLLAASVLRVLGRKMTQAGRHNDLDRQLLRLPERIIQAKPWLLLYRACCRRYTHAAENVLVLQKVEAMFRKTRDTRGLLLALGHLMEAVMLLGRDIISIHDLLAKGEELLSALEFSSFPREQAHLWLQMGFCHSLRGENTRNGYRASQNAFFLARKLKDRVLQIQALSFSMIPLTFLGEFSEADRVRARAEGMLQQTKYPELEAVWLKAWSELALFGGHLDLKLARSLIEKLHERIERFGLLYLQAPAMYSDFAYHMYAENSEKAEEIGQALQDVAEIMGNDFGRGLCSILRGLLAYRRRQWNKAKEYFAHGLEIFRHPESLSPLHDHTFSIGAGLVYIHLDNWKEAETLLHSSLQHFTSISSPLPRTETLLALALLYERKGSRGAALEYLESGLNIAAARDFTHFVIISPKDQVRLYVLALQVGSKTAKNYAARLMQIGVPETVAAEDTWLRKHPHPGVRKIIHDVVLKNHRSKRTPIYIQALGDFRVWVGQEALSGEAWKGNQARGLLKVLVALASEQQIRKELLIEELWPYSSPGAGEKTFKVALHRLRKSLEPDLTYRFGSAYIHLENGRVFMDQELCKTDVNRFLRLCRETEKQLQSGQAKKGLKTCNEVVSLYKGDFLPDDPDPEWARAIREHLRQKFMAVLLEAARACETSGTWAKAIRYYEKVLDCDPCLEEAYRRIMVLYADHGKPAKALQAYEKCRKILQETFSIEPENQTVSLYRKIRG